MEINIGAVNSKRTYELYGNESTAQESFLDDPRIVMHENGSQTGVCREYTSRLHIVMCKIDNFYLQGFKLSIENK